MAKKAKPDIQEMMRRHLTGTPAQQKKLDVDAKREDARRLARLVALKGLKLAKAGKLAEAKEAHDEALYLEREWRKLGGKGPLT
jgi:hypothetical protein